LTLDWILGVLAYRAYLDGTRYYETAECFLFFAARLLRSAPGDATLHARLAPLLRERVLERAGCPGDDLALAMRVLAGAAVGLRMERDLAALLPLQCEDGGWGPGWVYKYGSSGLKLGNRGLTTALALNAIAALYPPLPQQQEQQQQMEMGCDCCSVAIPTEVVTLGPMTPPRSPGGQMHPAASAVEQQKQQHPDLAAMGIPSPPPSPQPEIRKPTRRERGFSASAIAKGVYAYFFPSIGSESSPPQACQA
jgi:hypothetical protein